MAEADLSKIIGLIMENPELIEKIKELNTKTEVTESKKEVSEEKKEIISEAVTAAPESDKRHRRKELLHALKAYVSDERGRAIESMLSIADILDLMKTR